jgi:signal transduction histidine kinase
MLWSLGVSVAVWLAARHELNELLDESLANAAALMAPALAGDLAAMPWPEASATAARATGERHFAWQVVGADAIVLRRSEVAPTEAFVPVAQTGFSRTPGWRVYGLALGQQGRVLYVAQTAAERLEAMIAVALSAVLAAWSIGMLGYWWLRMRLQQELAPLDRLSNRLLEVDPLQSGGALHAAERAELQPMHDAIAELASRLSGRIQQERALAAHAAHALRTPLAGMDAQLAVALTECDPGSRERLQKVRAAGERLQRVVAALITLFRSGNEAQRVAVDIAHLASQIPVKGVSVKTEGACVLQADPDLLAAALANLMDNAARNGAHHITLRCPTPTSLQILDDGQGIDAARRESLQQALSAQAYQQLSGMGLMLADRVARAHGGELQLDATERGFAATLHLQGQPSTRG